MPVVDGKPAFVLFLRCGTCQFLFQRLEGADQTLSLEGMQASLAGRVCDLDDGILHAFGSLPPEGIYLPSLFLVEPRSVTPGQEGDYFSNEQVATWGPTGSGAFRSTPARRTTARSRL